MSYQTVDEYYEELAKALPMRAGAKKGLQMVADAHVNSDGAKIAAMNGNPAKLPDAMKLKESDKVVQAAKKKNALKKSFDTADEYMAEIEEIQKYTKRQVGSTIGGAAGGFAGPPGGAIAGGIIAGKHHRGEGAIKGAAGGLFGPPGGAVVGAHLATKYPNPRGKKPNKKSAPES